MASKAKGAVKPRTLRFTEDMILTNDDFHMCESWLAQFSLFSENMTRVEFTEDVLLKLLKYEIITRRREKYIARLFSRYNKVRAARQKREIAAIVAEFAANRRKG